MRGVGTGRLTLQLLWVLDVDGWNEQSTGKNTLCVVDGPIQGTPPERKAMVYHTYFDEIIIVDLTAGAYFYFLQRYKTVKYTTIFLFFAPFYFPASGQAVVTGFVPSSPRFLPSTFIARRVQQSHCSSIFIEYC